MERSVRVERIFRSSDINGDGCLDQAEFKELVRSVNPDAALNDGHLTLIQEEVWSAFANHIDGQGLTLDGFKQIYLNGYADVDRDYDVLLEARRAEREAATSADRDVSPRKLRVVEEGIVGMSAAIAQPALADASPLPHDASRSPELSGPSPVTKTAGDVFEGVQTPLPAPPSAHKGGLFLNHTPDDPKTNIAFAIRLPLVLAGAPHAASAAHDSNLLPALLQALPDGSMARIVNAVPTPYGCSVGVLCTLPEYAKCSEEAEYFRTVVHAQPEQIFPQSEFGVVQVLPTNVEAATGGATAAKAGAEVISAAIMAANIGCYAMGCAVRLSYTSAAEFKRNRASAFIEQLELSMPQGSAARVTNVFAAAAGGVIVTVAATMPATSSQHVQKIHKFCKRLRQDPAHIFDARAFGVPRTVAMQHAAPLPPSIGVTLRLIGVGRTSAAGCGAALPPALQNALPEGSVACLRSISVECDDGPDAAALAKLVATLPAGTETDAAAMAVSRLKAATRWVPDAALPQGTYAETLAAGPALEAAFHPEENEEACYFGLGRGFEVHGNTPNTEAITSPAARKKGSAPRSRSASPMRSPRNLLGRLFRRGNANAEATTAAALSPSPANAGGNSMMILRSPVPPALSNDTGQRVCPGAAREPVVAGYHRRPPSSQGSSGLAEAVEDLTLQDDAQGPLNDGSSGRLAQARVESIAAGALATADEISPIKVDALRKGGPPVIELVACAGAVNTEDDVTDGVDDDVQRAILQFKTPADEETDQSQHAAQEEEVAFGAAATPQESQRPWSSKEETKYEHDDDKAGLALGKSADNDVDGQAPPSSPERRSFGMRLLSALSPGRRRPSSDQHNEDGSSMISPRDSARLHDAATTRHTPPSSRKAGSDDRGLQQQQQLPATVVRPALTPWEAQQRNNYKEWAIMDGQIKQLVSNLQSVLDNPRCGAAEVSNIQDAASMLPDWARHSAHMEIGERLSAAGLYQEAMRSLKEASAALPDDALARFRLGNVHFALHQYNDAARAYHGALRRCDPEDPLMVKLYINLGIAMESDGVMEAAERQYARAAALAPSHPRVHKLVGSARCALGDAAGAVRALKRAVAVNPEFADAWADMGCARAALGETDEAWRCFHRALQLDPEHLEAHFNVANMLRQADRPAEAMPHFDRALTADPDHWRSWLGRGVALGMMNNGQAEAGHEAAICLQRAVELSGALNGAQLADEVEELRRMVRMGAAGARALSSQVSAIEDKVKRSMTPGPVVFDPENSIARTMSVQSKNSVASSRSRKAGRSSRSETRSVCSVATSSRPGGYPGAAAPRSVISVRSMRSLVSPNKNHQRLATWTPPTTINDADVGDDVKTKLRALNVDVGTALATLDVPLLQALQPVTCVTPDAIWAEAKQVEALLTVPFQVASPDSSRPAGAAASSSARSSPNKAHARVSSSALADFRGKRITVEYADAMLRRLITAHAPAANLVQPAVTAACDRMLPWLEQQEGLGTVDASIVLCCLLAMIDASARDRLDLSYHLLMWRTTESPGAEETPVTRGLLIELISALKLVFEQEHRSYGSAAARPRRAADAQFVRFERFASDLARFFPMYDGLPLLGNPLS